MARFTFGPLERITENCTRLGRGCGRDTGENRRLDLARSTDGVHWRKLRTVFSGDQPWDAKVICDPTVEVAGSVIRVWFGGGDVASPDENLHGKIDMAILRPVRSGLAH